MKNIAILLGILLLSSCSTTPKKTAPEPAPTPAHGTKTPEKTALKKYPDQPQFTANCHFEGQSFSLRFQSKSGKMESNDMSVTLVTDDREVPLNLTPGWYHAVDSVSSLPNHCEGVPAYQFDGLPQLLLIFNLDQTETTLVLIDLKSKRVVNKLERVGKIKVSETPAYHVIPAENGFQLRLIRDPVKGTEDWKWIIIRKGSITSKWMRSNKKSVRY